MVVTQRLGDIRCLIQTPRPERAPVYLDETNNIGPARTHELGDGLKYLAGRLEIAAAGEREMKTPPHSRAVPNIVEEKPHTPYILQNTSPNNP